MWNRRGQCKLPKHEQIKVGIQAIKKALGSSDDRVQCLGGPLSTFGERCGANEYNIIASVKVLRMKQCPDCSKLYTDDTLNFCFDDGAGLVAAASRDDMPTQIMDLSGEGAARNSVEALHQEIQYCETADGVSIAYSVIGQGPPLVRVLGHFTHLEMEWEWPDLRHFWERLARRFSVIRYDGRGIGLSGHYTGDFTEETRQLDLEAVLTASGAESASLLGISEGGWTAAAYSIAHPERVSRLILYGAYSRGARSRPSYDAEEDEALITLIKKGWGRNTPAFRQVFTSYFFRTDADPNLIAHFNELQRASADPDTAARYWRSVHSRGDGTEMFRQVKVPTLVVHCRDDMAVSADEGRLLASIIPGAHLVLLPSGTHYFPTDREVITKVAGAIERFVGE